MTPRRRASRDPNATAARSSFAELMADIGTDPKERLARRTVQEAVYRSAVRLARANGTRTDRVDEVANGTAHEFIRGVMKHERVDNLEGYLRRIAKHRTIDASRKQGTDRVRTNSIDAGSSDSVPDGLTPSVQPGAVLAALVELEEHLEAEQRRLLRMLVAKMNPSEIANELDLSPMAARQRIRRLREAVRAILAA